MLEKNFFLSKSKERGGKEWAAATTVTWSFTEVKELRESVRKKGDGGWENKIAAALAASMLWDTEKERRRREQVGASK